MLKGFKRGRDICGIRDHIVVMSTVACVNAIVESIARHDRDVIPITHQHGCTNTKNDIEQIVRVLSGICSNPNVGGVLLVALGCESIAVKDVVRRISLPGRMIKSIIVQQAGSSNVIALAKKYLAQIKKYVAGRKRREFDVSNLVVGLECGASDPFSAITANPALGLVSDRLVELGATVIIAEIPEMIGAEKLLDKRIKRKSVRDKLFSRIDNYIETSRSFGCDLLGVNPTPGNIGAGLSTIEEKSLGCIAKAGTTVIREFVEYGQKPTSKGLIVMDTPGNDPESLTALAAGGAQLILFTTGLGTPLGCPVAPVIKICSNSRTYKRMKDYIDIDAGTIIKGQSSSGIADKIFSLLVDICNGKKTCSEQYGSSQIAINRLGPTF